MRTRTKAHGASPLQTLPPDMAEELERQLTSGTYAAAQAWLAKVKPEIKTSRSSLERFLRWREATAELRAASHFADDLRAFLATQTQLGPEEVEAMVSAAFGLAAIKSGDPKVMGAFLLGRSRLVKMDKDRQALARIAAQMTAAPTAADAATRAARLRQLFKGE